MSDFQSKCIIIYIAVAVDVRVGSSCLFVVGVIDLDCQIVRIGEIFTRYTFSKRLTSNRLILKGNSQSYC